MRHAGGRAREAVADDHRVLGRHQHPCCLRDGARVCHWRHHPGELRDAQALRVGDRVFLELGVEREQDRRHRRRHRDLVGAHRRLGEMLERGGLVVPLDEIAHQSGGVDGGVHPFDAGRPLVPLDDVADHDIDRDAVAPGVVQRHAGMLEPDGAVAHHRHRLAFHLGVALRHVDGDLLVRAGEDFGLRVLSVVDEGFVDAAECRGAVHREIVEIERSQHVDHEIAAARGLIHRVLGGRQRFDRNLLRPGNGGLEIRFGRGHLRARRNRGERGGADEAGALEEIAALGAG